MIPLLLRKIPHSARAVALRANALGSQTEEMIAAQASGIIDACPALLEILRQVERVARTTLPVLILGASSTDR
jgi:transcriptional regulator with GAF, ATPase, and Fis domain